jgi:hypothetical protein
MTHSVRWAVRLTDTDGCESDLHRQAFAASVQGQLGPGCGWWSGLQRPKVKAMNTAPALPLTASATTTRQSPAPVLTLAPGQVRSLHRCAGRQLTLVLGQIWLTEPGDLDDHFLRCGQTRVLMSEGQVVIENDGAAPALYRLG